MTNWIAITRVGGVNVMLPAAVAIAAWLGASRAWRMAACWCLLFAGVLAVTVASKLSFIGWGVGIRSLDFTGVSGHAARAMAVVPTIVFLGLLQARRRARIAGVAIGVMFAMLIAISRLTLHAHSISEVVAGCLLGGAACALFAAKFDRPRMAAPGRAVAALVISASIAATTLKPAPTQRWMIASALYLSGHDRPYIRQGWRLAPLGWTGRSTAALPPPGA
jgi:membrane-associated phospholipid phosphatase